MKYSTYQLAIWDAVASTVNNLMVDAKAGSGKSFTIKRAVNEYVPKNLSVFMGAFNKHIAEALKPEITHPRANIKTNNGFGWGACLRAKRSIELDAQKTEKLYKNRFDMYDKQDKAYYFKTKGAVNRLVSLFKASMTFQPTHMDCQQLMINAGVELPVTDPKDEIKIFDNAIEVFHESNNITAYMDFDDQVWMPIFHGWSVPQYDVGFMDELQDFNAVNLELMLRACKRVVGVGDPRQSIYAFRGADPDSMPNMASRTDAKILPLSVCYRCPKAVIREAQKIVPEIEHCEHAVEGKVETIKTEEYRKTVNEKDFVLCRTTAPLVSDCLKMIRDGRKATVKGRDIGQQIETLVDKIAEDDKQTVESFHHNLDRFYTEQSARLTALERDAELETLTDKVDTVRALMEQANDVSGIKRKIAEIFSDQVGAGVTFCTAHKSKGLESRRIFVLKPEQMPMQRKNQTEKQKTQELNLKYVTITRAGGPDTNGELYWVKP